MQLGFVGLGRMGTLMAANLIRAGHQLTVYNRTSRPSPLEEMGARFAPTARAAAESAGITFTMLSDNQAVEETVLGDQGLLRGMSAGQILVDCSTVSPQLAVRLATQAGKAGVRVLDAPVAGSVAPARDGTLVFMVGGEREVFEEVLPLLQVMGKAAIHMGDHGSGLSAKVAINTLLGLTTVALAEACALATASGVPMDSFLDLVGKSAVGSSPFIQTKLPLLSHGEYPVAFSLDHIYKDMGFALEEAHRLTLGLPAAAAGLTEFTMARARGWGAEDLMAVARLWSRD
ncbi:MAG TPA: NAD(P)-dependent oxidoreductase [Spirochaetia bacterium]|nr:NAD(P)-dependent oxidoreductase [Spirochaetia bacterium]